MDNPRTCGDKKFTKGYRKKKSTIVQPSMSKTIKITESEINKAVNAVFEELDEISRSQKAKIRNKAIGAINGADDNVKTFLIITAENPMGDKGGNRQNRNANTSLVDYLQRGNYAWQPVRGKYGNTENSKIIFNITLGEAKRLGLQFAQESFIYGKKNNGVTRFELYVMNENGNDYDFVEAQDKYINIGDEEKDFYTAIDNKHKFNIPFEYFNEACERFNRKINETKIKSEKYRSGFDRFLNESLKENKTGNFYYLNRTLLYGGMF